MGDPGGGGGHYEHVEGQHIVEHFSDRAIDYISRRDADQPFFLQVNYDGPYVLPPTVVGADERNPFHERFANTEFKAFPPLDERLVASVQMPFDFDLDPDEEYTLESVFNNLWWTVRCHNDQATRANIAAQNALVDHAVGRVVDHLEAEGLTEDTLVIMTTDQSNPYGQRGLWGHPPWTDPPFVHDVTMNVPLIIRRPGTLPAMRVNDRVVSHVDLLSTILEHVGLGDIEVTGSPGHSLEPMLHGRGDTWVDEAFFEAESARSIRTPEWLYTEHFENSGPTELYDLVADPQQWTNVADEPAYAEVVAGLGDRLTGFFEQHCDSRYDLWNGGTGQAMVSRYLLFKERWGDEWEPTVTVGPRFAD
ncbi:MAG: sulfatase family protein [Microthrixaceae bacterium]